VPGGVALISDLFDARGVLALPYNALSWLMRSRAPRDPELAAAWQAHGAHDDLLPLATIKKLLVSVMPGVTVSRHLAWRYTAIWRKP